MLPKSSQSSNDAKTGKLLALLVSPALVPREGNPDRILNHQLATISHIPVEETLAIGRSESWWMIFDQAVWPIT